MNTRIRLTSVAAAVMTALYGAQPARTAASEELGLEEVVVTATRHSANAQDIPLSITAITGATLEAAGITSIAELAHSMAGVNVTDKGPFGGVHGSTLIIRGMNSESTSGEFIQSSPIVQPVATYVDDTPLFVNLRLQDLNRVEILRGPQGTLSGSGSLGGTVRFVQNAPDPAAFDAKVDLAHPCAQRGRPLVLPGAINVGDATSRGFETELFFLVTNHFSAQLDYTYDQTKLTSLASLDKIGLSVQPPAVGAPLPGTPKNTAAVTLEYGHVALADGELRASVNAHYQSSMLPALSATIPTVSGYTMLGALVGYSRAHWHSTLYVNNLTNQLGINSYTDPANYGPNYQAIVSTPRTIGITV